MLQTTGTSKLGTGSGVLTLEQITEHGPASALDSLTERELEVLGLIANGDLNIGIAQKLHIKLITVERHITHLYSKLPFEEGVDKRVKAALMYQKIYSFEFAMRQARVNLSPREYEVLSLIAQGYSNPTIAQKLHIELKTADSHINKIYSKLPFEEGVNKRVMAALMYYRTPKYLSSQPTPSQPS